MKRVIQLLTLALFAISLLTAMSYAAESPSADRVSRSSGGTDLQRDANTITSPQARYSSLDIESRDGFFERLLKKVIILKNPFMGISVITIEDTSDDPWIFKDPPGPGTREYSTGPDLDEDPWEDIK